MVALLLACGTAGAQLKVGDDLSLTGSGTISSGYSGSYGNQTDSSHSLSFGGSGTINGSYYDPRFLSFSVNPFYNQSRANSNFQSITDATGVAISSNIFSGSHFPGAVTYNNTYNSQGSFAIPGAADFITHGHGQAFGVNWSANLPDAPSVSAGFTVGNSSYSIYGTNGDGSSGYRNFYVHSQYLLAGFDLSGGLNLGASHAEIPAILAGGPQQSSTADTRNFNFAASHLLPTHGVASAAFTRTDLNSDYLGYSFNGSIDTVNVVAGFNPTNKWNVSFGTSYSDNLSGQIYQSIVPTGGQGSAPGATEVQTTSSSASSHAFDFSANTVYSFAPNLQVHGQFIRRTQLLRGVSFGEDSLGGGVIYSHPVAGGYINANFFASDNKLDNSNASTLGLTSNASYNRRFGHWIASMAGSYGQNVQTLLVSYTTSNYGYNGSLARRIGRVYWSATAGGSHSGLTLQPNTRYASQSYSTGLGVSRISFQAAFTTSDGNGLVTGTGVTPGPIPPIVPTNLLSFFGGSSTSFSLSGSPVKRLTVSATYAKANSNTSSQGVFSDNKLEEEIFFMQYRFRKMGLSGGYSHVVQGFSASNLPPANFSSFSVSVYRWFNFF